MVQNSCLPFNLLDFTFKASRNSLRHLSNMADELKALGNKAIAEKNFDEAV